MSEARDRDSFVGGGASSAATSTTLKSRLEGEIKPLDLREYSGPLYVRNLTTSVISHDDGKGNVLRVEPVHSGQNTESLPVEVARDASFQRLWRRGKVQVTTDPEMEQALLMADMRAEELDALRKRDLETITENDPAGRDLVQEACLKCSDVFFTTTLEALSNPPLCEVHRPLASSFVPAEGVDKSGKRTVTWSSATVTAKERGQAI